MIALSKVEAQAPGLVNLAKKAQESVIKHDLAGVTAKVALVLDYSGSARHLYKSGIMQATAEKILAIATAFDDDGDIDVFGFHQSAWYGGSLGLTDYQGGIDRIMGKRSMGTTNYAKAFEAVVDHYFPPTKKRMFGKSEKADTSVPVYCVFLTDGRPDSKPQALVAARESSKYPVFFQSVGMGSPELFSFLADDLNNHGGPVDNFGFFTDPDISKMSDDALLDGLLNEFPQALQLMRAAGTLTS